MTDRQRLTADELKQLEAYQRHARFSGFDVRCGDCADRARCCRDGPPRRRSMLRRLLGKA